MLSKILKVVGAILAIIGLSGLPDDIQAWRSAMTWLSTILPGSCDVTGNCGRWFLTGIGVLLLLVASDVPGKLLSRWRKRSANSSPLKINFPDERSCSEFISEPAQIGPGIVSRKIFWVNIKNNSDHNVRNIRAEIGSFRFVTDSGAEEAHPVIASKTFPLRFQDGKTLLDCSPRMSAHLYLISYAQQFQSSFIRIEGLDREAHSHQFMHSSKPWKFKVTVTADEFMPVQREFMASVDGGGIQMSACD